jgi:hypothetical protein
MSAGSELARLPVLVKKITAKRAWTLGVVVAAASLCCGGAATGADVSPIRTEESSSLDAHTVTVAALDCFMQPIVYDAPPWEKNTTERSRASLGAESGSCVTAAQAIRVRPWRLYRHSPDAVFDLRHAVVRQAGASPSAESKALVSLFDLGTAAALEGRRAHAALLGDATAGRQGDALREPDKLMKLDEFGRQTEGAIGAEARAVAMLLATSDFLQVARLPADARPLAASPLIAVVFGRELAPNVPEDRTPQWGEYIAATARAASRLETARLAASDHSRDVGNRPAIGGGPVVHGERENLRSIIQAMARELAAVGAKMPPSPLTAAVDRNLAYLSTFDVDSALSDEAPDRER